jgi:hypothetical protein
MIEGCSIKLLDVLVPLGLMKMLMLVLGLTKKLLVLSEAKRERIHVPMVLEGTPSLYWSGSTPWYVGKRELPVITCSNRRLPIPRIHIQ